MEKKRPTSPVSKLVTLRYLGDCYAYQDGDAGQVLLEKGDEVCVRLAGHWAVLVEIGQAEIIAR